MIDDAVYKNFAIISYQIIQETLKVILGKLPILVSVSEVQYFLKRVLQPLSRVMPRIRLFETGAEIQARYQYGSYDSLIVVAALEAGYKRLLTEDVRHGQRIEQLKIENPFLSGSARSERL